MPSAIVTFREVYPLAATTIDSRAIPRGLTTLDKITWLRLSGNPSSTFAAWFYGDTSSPNYNLAGNENITDRTQFLFGIKQSEPEELLKCQRVPPWARGIAIEIKDPSPTTTTDTFVY